MSSPAPFFDLSDLGLGNTASALMQSWLTQMQTAFPGYAPSASNLEYVLAQIFASFAADNANLASMGSDALFQAFGTQLIKLPFQTGSPAIAVVTVTAGDSAGHTLGSGTQMLLTLDGVQVGFQTLYDLVIPVTATSGNVPVAAIAVGSLMNSAAGPAQMNANINWVTDVTVLTPAADGVDPESSSHYLTRLAATLTTMAPRPITAQDYAVMAIDFSPDTSVGEQEVGRATAIDGYDPGPTPGPDDAWSSQAGGTNTYNNEREITLCITDDDGDALQLVTAQAVQAWFESKREMNFIINVVAPNYNPVYVTVTVKGNSGYDPATVQADVQAALLAYLSPANFGLPDSSHTGWNNTLYIYRSRIDSVIQLVRSVDHVVTGTLAVDINPHPTNTTNDLTLGGPFPLPTSDTTSIPLAGITVV